MVVRVSGRVLVDLVDRRRDLSLPFSFVLMPAIVVVVYYTPKSTMAIPVLLPRMHSPARPASSLQSRISSQSIVPSWGPDYCTRPRLRARNDIRKEMALGGVPGLHSGSSAGHRRHGALLGDARTLSVSQDCR